MIKNIFRKHIFQTYFILLERACLMKHNIKTSYNLLSSNIGEKTRRLDHQYLQLISVITYNFLSSLEGIRQRRSKDLEWRYGGERIPMALNFAVIIATDL